MSETRIFRTETRPRREATTSREIENETRREIKQLHNVLKDLKSNMQWGGGGREERKRETGGQTEF
jgi:hypothetical protein